MASRGGGFASQTLLQSQVRVIGGAGLCYVGLADPYPREIPEPDVGGAACGASWHGEDERSSAQLCLVAELRQGQPDIERTVWNCTSCQQVRSLPSVAPVMPWIWPGAPWHRVHLDFAEEEGRHYLVVVDAYSKWPEVVMMNSTTTGATIEVMRGLFSRYGIPLQIINNSGFYRVVYVYLLNKDVRQKKKISDNGPQFRSAEFQHFLKTNGVKHVRVAPYHAASNGAAERMVQSFKRSLSTSKSERSHLQRRIDSFLLAYRSTKHSTTGCTPSSLFLGRELHTRLSLVRPDLRVRVTNKQSDQKAAHHEHSKFREFFPGDLVLVKDVREREVWWPGTIAE